jgi:putative transposase
VNRTERILLQPTRAQRRLLERMLWLTWTLYNAALQERRDAWRLNRISLSVAHQMRELKEIDFEDIHRFGQTFLRWSLRRLDKAFEGFFDRVARNRELRLQGMDAPRPGFPRFKAPARQSTFGYSDRQSWKLDMADERLTLQGVHGRIRVKPHRPLGGEIRALQITRDGDKWYALITVEKETVVAANVTADVIGVDVGVNVHAATSAGVIHDNVRVCRVHADRIAKRQRSLARAQRGSKKRAARKRALAREYARIRNARQTRLHQISNEIVSAHPGAVIAFEDLVIRNMVRSTKGTVEKPGRNVRQKSGLNRAIHDACWGILIQFTTYKAESAGGSVVRVDPRNTSQRCSRCKVIVPKRRDGHHSCPHCGLEMHRDINAALNIEDAGRTIVGAPPRVVVHPDVGKLAA